MKKKAMQISKRRASQAVESVSAKLCRGPCLGYARNSKEMQYDQSRAWRREVEDEVTGNVGPDCIDHLRI